MEVVLWVIGWENQWPLISSNMTKVKLENVRCLLDNQVEILRDSCLNECRLRRIVRAGGRSVHHQCAEPVLRNLYIHPKSFMPPLSSQDGSSLHFTFLCFLKSISSKNSYASYYCVNLNTMPTAREKPYLYVSWVIKVQAGMPSIFNQGMNGNYS